MQTQIEATVKNTLKVETSRPLNALDKVGIAELAQFTRFDPNSHITVCAAADEAIRKAFDWELADSPLDFLDYGKARIVFKDGSVISFSAKRRR